MTVAVVGMVMMVVDRRVAVLWAVMMAVGWMHLVLVVVMVTVLVVWSVLVGMGMLRQEQAVEMVVEGKGFRYDGMGGGEPFLGLG